MTAVLGLSPLSVAALAVFLSMVAVVLSFVAMGTAIKMGQKPMSPIAEIEAAEEERRQTIRRREDRP